MKARIGGQAIELDIEKRISPTTTNVCIPGTTKDRNKPTAPYRSKWESAYSQQLEIYRLDGEIDGWLYEPLSFRLATGKRYRVDFVTWAKMIHGRYRIECIEVKGPSFKNRRDSLTHLAWAAQRFPFFTWRLVWRMKGGGWDGKYITP